MVIHNIGRDLRLSQYIPYLRYGHNNLPRRGRVFDGVEQLPVPVQEPDRDLHVHVPRGLPQARPRRRVRGHQRVRGKR